MKTLWIIILGLALSSCLKLDSNLYNNKNTIDSYKLDQYTDVQDFVLDNSYLIPSDKIHLFTLESKTKNENKSYQIQVMYVGDTTRIKSDTVIVYCHGNKWHMDFYWQRAKLLAHTNGKSRYGLLMMDYRGFGLSEGEPTETGMYADVEACLSWLKARGLNSSRFIFYGFSLGSASVCELSANSAVLKPSKIILEAPFGSAEIMVQDAARLNMPAAYFTDLKIDNAEEIKKTTCPFLWIHGTSDNFLNYKTHGEVVYKNYSGQYQEKYLVAGADHGEVPEKMGFENYLSVVGKFIRKP